MKKWIIGIALIGVACFTAAFIITEPQQKPLEKPTTAQIKAAFPDNTRNIFEHSDKFILLSLDPKSLSRIVKGKPLFHDYYVLGQTKISNEDVKQRIRAIYDDAIVPSSGFSLVCFNPRHGIRAVKDDKTLDLLICFHCGSAHVYLNSKPVTGMKFISSRQSEYDGILTAANVPLATKSPS